MVIIMIAVDTSTPNQSSVVREASSCSDVSICEQGIMSHIVLFIIYFEKEKYLTSRICEQGTSLSHIVLFIMSYMSHHTCLTSSFNGN